jgi:uncharacterized SAM-binding protein YcdF (DUF218 family)
LGNYLIYEDRLEKSDALFVLSGNSLDRGKEAALLYHQGYAPVLVCTGGVESRDLGVVGIHMKHSVLTRHVLMNEGVDSTAIEMIHEGESTHDEKEAIVRYCQKKGWRKVIVVSSKFHTRRIHKSFRKTLETAGITLILRGAPDSGFDEKEWWKYEDGLIFLNNEYIKILYYAFKY